MVRKFYRQVISVEVLSEEPLKLDEMDLSSIGYAITEGDCSGDVNVTESEEIDGPKMAELLKGHGSEPGSFQLSEEGEDLE